MASKKSPAPKRTIKTRPAPTNGKLLGAGMPYRMTKLKRTFKLPR